METQTRLSRHNKFISTENIIFSVSSYDYLHASLSSQMQMEKFTPMYSLKNIPFPKKHDFVLSLTDKIVDFIKRIRWKAHFHLNPAVPKEDGGLAREDWSRRGYHQATADGTSLKMTY